MIKITCAKNHGFIKETKMGDICGLKNFVIFMPFSIFSIKTPERRYNHLWIQCIAMVWGALLQLVKAT